MAVGFRRPGVCAGTESWASFRRDSSGPDGGLGVFLEMLPISYAGLGLREGVFVQLFAAQGVAGTLGIAYGLAFFAQFLIIGAFGGLCTLCRRGDGPVKSPAQAE